MERKIQDQFIDYGCGFPIVLKHVPMMKFQGKWIPDIDYNKFEKIVLVMLCHKESKLTGNEIKFIRLYFKMTLQVFAFRFGVKHPTVLKWENFKNGPTNMSLGTEKDIRLYIIVNLIGQEKVGELYCELGNLQFIPNTDHKPIELDIDRVAV